MGGMTDVANEAAADPVQEPSGLGSPREPVEVEVVAADSLGSSTLGLALARVDRRPVRYQPGQFCNLAIPGPDGDVWRSYSLATPLRSGEAVSRCEIAVAAVPGGLATEHLFACRPGDRLRASGPFGRLVLPTQDPAHYALIGTGTGLAPYRAMLPELERRAARQALRVTVVMGVRSPRDALYADEFRAFTDADSARRRLLVCYSRELPDPAGAGDRRGYVQDALAELELDPTDTLVYLCGNPDMIDTVAARCGEAGFGRRALIREKYQSRPARA